MKHLWIALVALWLAGCASISKMEGEQVVNERLVVQVTSAWNRVDDRLSGDPYVTWTQEGVPLDHLRFWGGVRPGETLMTRPMLFLRGDEKAPRLPTFKAGLRPEKLVSLFESLYATAGVVTVTKVDPTLFAGQKGVRFEFTLVRRRDDLPMRGVAWVAVRRSQAAGEELYAAAFVAPQLSFYERLLPLAEGVVKTARIRGS